ncbi:unnamed protein product, partial [Mesorhabditis spiculigera]
MDRLTRKQQDCLQNFIGFTNADKETAMACLMNNQWHVERAADYYYQNVGTLTRQLRQTGRPGGSPGKELFQKYANKPQDGLGPERIGPHGVTDLLHDLRLEATNRRVLILAWVMKAKTQCEFSQDEWLTGFSEMNITTINELAAYLGKLDKEMETDRSKYRQLYQFAFVYGKPERQRSMETDTALAYWHILFHDRYVLFDQFERYLKERDTKVITRDVWNLVFEFLEKINPDLSNYDDDGAWPTLLDNFVDYLRNERAAAA